MSTSTRSQEVEKIIKDHDRVLHQLSTTMEQTRLANEKSFESIHATLADLLRSYQTISNGTHPNNSSVNKSGGNQLEYHRGRFNNRFCKLEFPKFNGEDVDGWIYRVEQFFAVDDTPEQSKLRYAVIHLEDKALQWHQAHLRTRGATINDLTWPEYKKDIVHRFGDSFAENAIEELISLKQTGTLKDYCDAFDSLLNKVTLSEAYAISIFIHGLKTEIGAALRLFKPATLRDAYSLARIQDASISQLNNTTTSKPQNSTFSKPSYTNFFTQNQPSSQCCQVTLASQPCS
jgi:hypothetical protein